MCGTIFDYFRKAKLIFKTLAESPTMVEIVGEKPYLTAQIKKLKSLLISKALPKNFLTLYTLYAVIAITHITTLRPGPWHSFSRSQCRALCVCVCVCVDYVWLQQTASHKLVGQMRPVAAPPKDAFVGGGGVCWTEDAIYICIWVHPRQ